MQTSVQLDHLLRIKHTTDSMPRLLSYLSGSASAVCHPFTPRLVARQLHHSPLSFPASKFQRVSALHSSHRSAPYRHSHRALSQEVLIWILLTGAGISYIVYNAKPLLLESDETFKLLGSAEVKQKYLSPTIPLAVEQANKALRREEYSQLVGSGSGVLRYDTMQLPSNPISEDDYLTASGHEDGDIKWMLFGIYDGHA